MQVWNFSFPRYFKESPSEIGKVNHLQMGKENTWSDDESIRLILILTHSFLYPFGHCSLVSYGAGLHNSGTSPPGAEEGFFFSLPIFSFSTYQHYNFKY